MNQLKELSIFLASPSDVRQERALVREVIAEVNRTVAKDKGVVLDLVSSERAIPGYGKDGQAIINEQIGDMKQYDLFVGIMWNRIGTPTPRDISGTAEEFARAVKALQRRKKPEIWFYFRQASANLITQEQLDQRSGVLSFRSRLRGKGLFSEYTTLQSFERTFREHLVTWLNARSKKARPAPGTRGRKPGVKKPEDRSVPSGDTSTATAGIEPKPTPPRRSPVIKAPVRRKPDVAKSPGSWIMLDDHFYQAKSAVVQADRSVVLRIAPPAGERTADLRSLQAADFHRRREVMYADPHEAGITQVQSVVSETSQGKTIFTVTLAPLPQSNTRGGMTEFSFNAYSADTIADLRARLILLGQPLPKELEHVGSSYQMRSNYSTSITTSIHTLPQLWASLHTQSRLFLRQAWIYAAYLLKTGNIVENILTLELGPIKDKKMRVKFRGRRAHVYANQEPFTISIEGECVLEA